MKFRSGFHGRRKKRARKNVFLIAPRAARVARSRKMFNIKMRDATNTHLIRPCWNLKNTQSDFGFVACARPASIRAGHIDFQRARTDQTLSTKHPKASLKILHVHTYVHITDAVGCARARERTVWVGSCICGRGGGAYSCRVLIVNWFRSTRDSQVLSAEECFTIKNLSRMIESETWKKKNIHRLIFRK